MERIGALDRDPAALRDHVGDPVRRIGADPGDDRPHSAPRDPHQLAHRSLGATHRQPRDGVIEGVRMPGAMTSPGHRSNHHPMAAATHPWSIGPQHRLDRAQVQSPPTTPTSPPHNLDMAAGTFPQRLRAHRVGRTRVTNRSCSWSYSTDSNTVFDAQHGIPWADIAHAVLRSSVADLRQAQNLKRNGVLCLWARSKHPGPVTRAELWSGSCRNLGLGFVSLMKLPPRLSNTGGLLVKYMVMMSGSIGEMVGTQSKD
jgi:hypothetical protein